MTRLPLILLALSFAGCATLFHRGQGRDPLQLCVRNSTVGYGNLVAHAGLVRFTVTPGQESCKRISETPTPVRLTAETTGGGSLGPLSYNAELIGMESRCWRWDLGNSRATQGNLMPCELSGARDTGSSGGSSD